MRKISARVAMWSIAAVFVAAGFGCSVATPKCGCGPNQAWTTFHPKADANQQIDSALGIAKVEYKRVVLLYGENSCAWCRRLYRTMLHNKKLKKLSGNYVFVPIDIRSNMKLPQRYGAKVHCVPYLTVLNADGSVVRNQSTGVFEQGDHYGMKKIAAFLNKYEPTIPTAKSAYHAALAQAKKQDKRLFVHVGAVWSTGSQRLDQFLASPDVQRLMQKDYVEVNIDMDRMKDGAAFAQRLRAGHEGGGIPWTVIMSDRGKPLATFLGYPVESSDVHKFMSMLRKTRQHMSNTQLTQIQTALEQAAKQYRHKKK